MHVPRSCMVALRSCEWRGYTELCVLTSLDWLCVLLLFARRSCRRRGYVRGTMFLLYGFVVQGDACPAADPRCGRACGVAVILLRSLCAVISIRRARWRVSCCRSARRSCMRRCCNPATNQLCSFEFVALRGSARVYITLSRNAVAHLSRSVCLMALHVVADASTDKAMDWRARALPLANTHCFVVVGLLLWGIVCADLGILSALSTIHYFLPRVIIFVRGKRKAKSVTLTLVSVS
jgi:hypothetical protein